MKNILLLIGISLIFLISARLDLFSEVKNITNQKVGIDENLGKYIPLDLKFANSNGDSVILRDIIKQPTIISLAYFECTGICSPLLTSLTRALNYMKLEPGKEFQVITLSFDSREQFTTAAKWKTNYKGQMNRKFPDDSWYFLTGDSVTIKKLTNSLGFYYMADDKGQFIHSGSLFVISPKGLITRYLFYDKDFSPFDMKMAVIEADHEQPNPTINKVLQFCFSYDAKGKRYVFNLTRIIGSVMIMLVVIFFTVLVIKKKKKNNIEEIND